ncbi:helix-turn-helix domain-containing protein [Labedella populi]|nr:helix-turn-helix domain-containing protein [Labedella populi]
MEAIAAQVREARTGREWSQEHLAELSGVSRPTIARIEGGDHVNTAKLTRVADALGLSFRLATTEEPTERE